MTYIENKPISAKMIADLRRSIGHSIGTELMNRIIERLKQKKIFMISVIYGNEELASFKKIWFFSNALRSNANL